MVGNCNSTANVIFISAFIESGEQQILLVLFVVVVSLFFTALLRPFYDDRLVKMEMLSLIVCFLTFFFGSMLLTDEKCVEEETFLCIGAEWLVILINAGCVLFLGINFGSNLFTEKGDLVKKYCKLFKKKLCCCFDDKRSDENLTQCRESYVEMSVVMHLMIIMLQVALMMSIVLVVGMSTIRCEEPLFS